VTLARRFGFAGGVAARVAVVTGYALAAALAIALVETRPAAAKRAAPAPVVSARDHVDISIESTYPVSTWIVRYAGIAVAGIGDGTRRWRGQLALDPDERQLVVEASPQDPLADGPCALRVALRQAGGVTEATTLWGNGFISGIVPLPGQAAP